jgi:hypothetical protein
LVAVRKDRDTKAELNRRSQACEVLAGTGIRVARMVEHQGIAPCIPVWKTGVCLSTPMLEEMARRAGAWSVNAGIPYRNRTGLCGFANRRLN